MIELDFFKNFKTPIVVALGFFDSIHIGHRALIEKAILLSKKYNCKPAVFTFKNDISSVVSSHSKGLVFTFYERLKKLEKYSINQVIFTNFTKEFSSLTYNEFLTTLFTNFNIKAIVCGDDYRFGNGGLGNVEILKSYCVSYGIELCEVGEISLFNERVSTGKIKELLLQGKIELANKLLGDQYFICGTVQHGRRVGKSLGFPTANINISSEKLNVKYGVYKTHVFIEGKLYSAITNYGTRPTYGLDEILTETHIKGFDGNLYGKEIIVYFDEYLRECVKFANEEELKIQLQKDLGKLDD